MARVKSYRAAEKKIEKARRTGATELDLRGMGLTELPESLGQLTQLQTLNLQRNQLTALPESLGQLTQLQTLDLNNNQLTALPESLGQLTQLQKLELSNNQLTALPESLGQLTQLKTLNLSRNQLTALPESLGQLTQLQELSFSNNQLTAMPEWLGQFTLLRELGFTHNQLTALPEWLGQLTQLNTLWLYSNQLATLPESIGRLTELTLLDVSGNQLTDVPDSLVLLTKLTTLNLGDKPDGPNPLNLELAAAYEQGLDAVKAYVRAKAGASVVLNEAKLILIGEGEVGKSSLLGAMRGDDWIEKRDTTHGIEIKPVGVTDAESQREITLNAWDFGGQPVYRPTHQLFFSAPAVYLVVWKPREGPQQGFVKEWIKLVQLREPEAQVLVVATHGGPGARLPDIDRQEILDEFGRETVLDFHHVESRPDGSGVCKGVDELKTVIARVAADLPEVGRKVPKSWQDVREALEGKRKAKGGVIARFLGTGKKAPTPAWMRHDEFVTFCSEHGGMDEAQADLFTKVSHTLGHLIHYAYDEDLKNIVILKPDWLATAISFVFDDRQTRDNHGLVSFERLGQLWDDPQRAPEDRYPGDLHPAFVRLMERFDLSYRVVLPDEPPGSPPTSLISLLVPDTRPDELPDWGPKPAEEDFEQKQICRIVDAARGRSSTAEGLFFQLITRLHKYSLGRADFADSVHWQRGLMLDDDYSGRALLEHIGNDIHITVRAAYPEWFLSVLTREVKWLVESFWEGLRCEVTVPCIEPCGKQAPGTGLFEVEKLVAFQRQGMTQFPCLVSGCNQAQTIIGLLSNSPSVKRAPDAIELAPFDVVQAKLDVIHNELRVGFEDAERRGLNRFLVLHTAQKRLMSMIDEQFDGLMQALVDEAKEGPRLFSLEALEPEGIIERIRRVGKEQYRLTLWCEHARLPLTELNGEDEPDGFYDIAIPNEWLVGAASFLSKLNTVLSLVLPVAASGAKLFLPDSAYTQIGRQLEFDKTIISSLVKGGDTIGSLMSAGESAESRFDVRGEGSTRADGSLLRQLHGFLEEKDSKKEFGGLVRVQNKRREFLWVHKQFVDEY